MSYNICCVPIAALRILPHHTSEMVSQLLFGECALITDWEKNGWCKIIAKQDHYTGWCLQSQLYRISEEDYLSNNSILAAEWINKIEFNGTLMMIPFGSDVSKVQDYYKNTIQYQGLTWNAEEALRDSATIRNIANFYLNTSYLWGGRSVFGTDCSGFTQQVFRFLNITLPRDSHMQAQQGEPVNFLQEGRCGDLAFFDNEEGKIIHVGILLSSGEIIHAAGKVRVDMIDNQGLINSDTGIRSQQLRIIKRYF